MSGTVSVLIPTFRRPLGLARAIASVMGQTRLPDEIVVVDNDPEGSGRELVEDLARDARAPLVYVHEPRPGVSHARNTGFARATGRFIAQLDDDEGARPEWLESLLATREGLDTPVVFGPVTPLATGQGPIVTAMLERLYARTGPDSDAERTRDWGCGNSLLDRSCLTLPDPVFDPRTNETGGEDDVLFVQLRQQGVSFGWSARAEVIEFVEGNRVHWKHLLARSFAYGQGASQNCVHGSRVNVPALAGWMVVGAAQALVYGLAALPAALAGGPKAGALCIDKAVQGLGKLIWADSLAPRFYGSAARG